MSTIRDTVLFATFQKPKNPLMWHVQGSLFLRQGAN